MPSDVVPSHRLFFSAQIRHWLWLQRHWQSIESWLAPEAAAKGLELLRRLERRWFADLDLDGLGYSIARIADLERLTDDTPVDSFLSLLWQELLDTELELHELSETKDHRSETIRARALESAGLWGRLMAQETLLSKRYELGSPRVGTNELHWALQSICFGGEVWGKPMLLRRKTFSELEFEPRTCAHARAPTHPQRVWSCQLQAATLQGFAETISPFSSARRVRREDYCLDIIRLSSEQGELNASL